MRLARGLRLGPVAIGEVRNRELSVRGGADLAQLAQIIEQDLGLRSRFLEVGFLSVAEIAQKTIADAAPGHGAQALLDAHQGGAGIRIAGIARLQDDRVQGGEPTHGARDIDVVEQGLAAVPFEVHPQARRAGPARQSPDQGAEQRIVDAAVVGRRQGLEQVRGLFGGELAGDRGLVGDEIAEVAEIAAHGEVHRQARHGNPCGLAPVAPLASQLCRAGMPGEAAGPLLERSGLGREGGTEAARGLAVRPLQVFDQHAPGDPVHHQMMGNPEEPCRLPGADVEEAEAGQRSGRQVEAGLESRGSRGEGRAPARRRQARKVDLVERRDRWRDWRDLLPPAARPPLRIHVEAHPQGVVVRDDRGHGELQGGGDEGLFRLQEEGLVEVVGVRTCPARRTSAGSE